ncbi:MAG: hypothetical protein UHM85_00020 [Acutalibacteraceae bacterium]|nr:hypothetical protein [Acutalibacteraceae bacterium]
MKIPENYIRKIMLLALVVITAVFQHTDGAIPTVFGAKAMLLVPLVVAIAVHERSMNGLFYGALAGILWDFATVRGDGFFSVGLCGIGFISGCLVTYVMRNSLATNMLLGGAGIFAVNTVYWFVFIFRKGYEGAADVLFGYYLPSVLYTLIFSVVYYYIVGFIHKATVKKKN